MNADAPAQTARFERKREAILETAAQLFNARGLGGATIADVAQGVGLTTASVTYY
jgi:AcrR family transcriptional regulator